MRDFFFLQKNRFKIDALLAIMEEIPVQRNLQTYAALIECEGINRPIHKQAVSNIMTDMREKVSAKHNF